MSEAIILLPSLLIIVYHLGCVAERARLVANAAHRIAHALEVEVFTDDEDEDDEETAG